MPPVRPPRSYLQYYRHDQRPLLCLLGDIAFHIATNFFFDHAIVGFLFFTRLFQGLHHDLPRTVHKAIFAGGEAASDDLRRGFDSTGKFVNPADREPAALFAQVAAVLDYDIFYTISA